jgi:hypothetical protein
VPEQLGEGRRVAAPVAVRVEQQQPGQAVARRDEKGRVTVTVRLDDTETA